MPQIITEESKKETQAFKTVKDFYLYNDEPLYLEDALKLFKEYEHSKLEVNIDVMKCRINSSNTSQAQKVEAYNELIVGYHLLRFAEEHGFELIYEDDSFRIDSKPDWTVIDGEERFVMELATKHYDEHSRIKDAIVSLIQHSFPGVYIDSSLFPNKKHTEKWNCPAKDHDFDSINRYGSELLERIDKVEDSKTDISIDGLKIIFNSNMGNHKILGSIPHRYMLTIAEKARKFDALAEMHPVIIGVASTNYNRTTRMPLTEMVKKLFGELSECIPEQLNLSRKDYCTIKCGIPSLRKVAGIMFYHLRYSSDGVRIDRSEYFRNPHYEKEYPKVLESYLQCVSGRQ